MTDDGRPTLDRSRVQSSTGPTLVLIGLALVVALSVAAGGALAVPPAASGDSLVNQFESNDGIDEATALTVPFEYAGLQASTADSDYYAVELDRGDRFEVGIAFDNIDGDLDLLVHDSNGDVVAESLSFTDDEDITHQAAIDGTHYVAVTSWNDTATSYTLSGTRTAGDMADTDVFGYNDGFSSATAIGTYSDRAELQLTDRDVDVYAVNVEEGRRITVTSRFRNGQADIDLELYDPDQDVLVTSATSSDNESLSTYASAGGTYYVRVTSDSTAYYSLHVADEASSGVTDTATVDATSATDSIATPSSTEREEPKTATEPPADTATTESQRDIESERRATTEQSTDAVGPGFGVFTVVAAMALFVIGRRW